MAEIVSGGSTFTLCYDADFYPFGGEEIFTNTCTQNYKWTGKERDPETGNDDFDARYYASAYGRFLSADWSAVPVPVPYANLTNPQTLNLYAIVRDNPESYADNDGHCIFGIDTAVCIVVGATVAIAATYLTFHHIQSELQKREEAERKAFERSYNCAFNQNARCSESDLRAYDQVRANTYKKGAALALEHMGFPAAEIPTSLKDLGAEEMKALAIRKMIEEAQKRAEEEDKKHPYPHAGPTSDIREKTKEPAYVDPTQHVFQQQLEP